MATAIPNEFAADILIQIANAPATAHESAEWRARLYEQAFELAAGAQEPRKFTYAPGALADSRSGAVGRGYNFELDLTSLRARAAIGLLPLKRQRALELAETINPDVPATTCDDWVVPDPGRVYELAALISSTRPNGQPESDHSNAFLERVVTSVRSSTQIGPALKAIMAAKLAEAQSRALLVAMAGILNSLNDNDRAFSATFVLFTWPHVKRLVETLGDDVLSDTFMRAFRSYLVRQLTGERCSRVGAFGGGSDLPLETQTLADVDTLLARKKLPRLTQEERTAIRLVPSAPDYRFWTSPKAKALSDDSIRLVRNGRELRLDAEKRTPEWAELLKRYLALMDSWSPNDEPSELDYFNQRCGALSSLINAMPAGDERKRAVGEFIRFLTTEGTQRVTRLQWICHVRFLINKYKDTADRGMILQALMTSGDPVMDAYARLESAIGGKQRAEDQ